MFSVYEEFSYLLNSLSVWCPLYSLCVTAVSRVINIREGDPQCYHTLVHGRWKEGSGNQAPRLSKLDIFLENFQQKKVVFLVSSNSNDILPSAKLFLSALGKSTIGPSLKQILPTPMYWFLFSDRRY